MVDWVAATMLKEQVDVIYNVIQRDVMEKRFPGSKRTWTKLKDMEICGGDMNAGRLKLIIDDETEMWEKITNSRKSPLKQAALIGFSTAFQLLTGGLTLAKAETNIMNRLNISGKAIVCPYAEVGMDVDKPHQLEIIRADLKKRLRKAEKGSTDSKKKTANKKPAGKVEKASPAKKNVSSGKTTNK